MTNKQCFEVSINGKGPLVLTFANLRKLARYQKVRNFYSNPEKPGTAKSNYFFSQYILAEGRKS